ncbi:MAG TPA: prolipoprotein diacylglyceryl transferase [Anaerolineales bacterium]|nr:prolipoprotein diacylglyceryl transferase [Anaerolineales bacterium]
MIDPVIFSIELFGLNLTLRWYGVIVMIGVIVGSLIVERELSRRGEKGDRIWDALIYVLPAGIIGARLWYVLNAILGGNRSYLDNPASIIRVWEGGLHIFGGFLFGALALLYYLRQNKLDPWLFLDAAGPAALVGQGIGRLANFINQELYGPPTTLPWGIPIAAEHRLPQYQELGLFPVESTRFHPTFAYEMLWNFASAGLLLWLSRRYKEDIKPGAIFAGWLILAGIGRVIVEFFRPDQPKIPSLGISYSSIFAALMAIAGVILLMARYKAINLKFAENWEEEYKLSNPMDQVSQTVEGDTQVAEPVKARKAPRARKDSTVEDDAEAAKMRMDKLLGRRTKETKGSPPSTKKS